jgi:hypothetical protein
MKNEKNLAHQYALGIVGDVLALEFLEDHIWQMESAEDLDEIIKENDGEELRKDLENLVSDFWDSSSEYGGFIGAYFSDVLDIESTHGADGTRRNVSFVVTVGGPFAEIVSNGSEFVTVKVAWGSDRYEMSVSAPNVSDHIYESWDVFA